jgi:CheY-like chemotaxis protein
MAAAPAFDPPRTALVVDDEPVVRYVVRRFLARTGWTVVEAESAERALELLGTMTPPDFVLCDLNLHGIGGAAFCRRVATHHPALLPRLVLTSGDVASASRELQRAALDCPILPKPFSLADLERVVDAVSATG